MAFRDKIQIFKAIAASGYNSFKTNDDGVNYLIKNIDTRGKTSLEYYKEDGALSIEIESTINSNGLHLGNVVLHNSNTVYYRTKNNDTTSKYHYGGGVVSRADNIGDSLIQNIERKSAGQVVSLRPPDGEEWTIHNILFQKPIQLSLTTGVGSQEIIRNVYPSINSGLMDLSLECTHDLWWNITHMSTSYNNIGYDGVKTKEVE